MDGEYTRADDGWDSGWNDDDNCEDEMYNCDPHGSDSDVDLQELEEALYSQIHYGSGIGEAMTCQVGDHLCDVQVEDKSEVQAEEESTVLINDNSINESNRNNSLPASGVHKVDSLDVSPKKSESANFAISHKCPMKNSKPKKKVSRLGLKQFLYKNENKELDNSRRSSDAKIKRKEGTDSSSSIDSGDAKSKTNISQSKERVIIESSNSDVILLDSNTDDKISASKDLDSSGSCIVVDNDAVTQSPRTSAESAEIPDNVVVIDSDFSSDQESDSSFLVFTSSDDDTSPVPKGKKKTSKLADLNINIQDYKHLLESGDSDNDVGETGTRIELQKSKPFVRATSRYYGLANIRCFICNEKGHTSKSCPKPKSLPVCILCGVRGHIQGRCPDSLCYRCNHVGHRSTDCEIRWGTYNAVCRRCDMTGHMASECSDLWRQYHITNGLGPLVKGSGKINKNPFCYNCAKKGHFGFECKKKPMQDRMLPCCPLISRYALPSVANYPMSHKRKFPDCSAFQQELTQEVPIKRPRIQQPIALNDISEFASKAKKKLTKQEKKALKIAKKEMASKQKLPKKKKKAAAAKEITKSKDESALMSKNQKKRSKRKKKIAKIKGSTALSESKPDAVPLLKITTEGIAGRLGSKQVSHSLHENHVAETQSITENNNRPPSVNSSFTLNNIKKPIENRCELKSDTLPTILKVTKMRTSSTLNGGPSNSSSTPKHQPLQMYFDPDNCSTKIPSNLNIEPLNSSSTPINPIIKTLSNPNTEPAASSSTPNNEIINSSCNPNNAIISVSVSPSSETRKSIENIASLDDVKIREKLTKNETAENVTVPLKVNTDCDTETRNPVNGSALKIQGKLDPAACVLSRKGSKSDCSLKHNVKPIENMCSEVIKKKKNKLSKETTADKISSISSAISENESSKVKKPSKTLCSKAKVKKKKKKLSKGNSDKGSSVSSCPEENQCFSSKGSLESIGKKENENVESQVIKNIKCKNKKVLNSSSELRVKKGETEKQVREEVRCVGNVCKTWVRVVKNNSTKNSKTGKDAHVEIMNSAEEVTKEPVLNMLSEGTIKKGKKRKQTESGNTCITANDPGTVKVKKKTARAEDTVSCQTNILAENGGNDISDFADDLNDTNKIVCVEVAKNTVRRKSKQIGNKKTVKKTVSFTLLEINKSESVCVEISKDTVNCKKKKKTRKKTVDSNVKERGILVENTNVVFEKKKNNSKLLQIDKSAIINLNCCETCDSLKTDCNFSVHSDAGKSLSRKFIIMESVQNKASENAGKQDSEPVIKKSKKAKEQSVTLKKSCHSEKTKTGKHINTSNMALRTRKT